MEIKSELGFEPFLEFLFGAEESSEDAEECQEELDSGCDYVADGSICLDDDSEGSSSGEEHAIEFIASTTEKGYAAPAVLMEIYARNTEELVCLPNKACHCSVSKAGKKVALTTKKAKKVFASLKSKFKPTLSAC